MLLFLFACKAGPIEFHDSVDLDASVGRADTLDAPYLLGSTLTLSIHRTNDRRSIEGYRLELAEDGIFEVIDATETQSEVRALAVGTTTLRALDPDGELVDEVQVEVAAPAEVELRSHALTQLGEDTLAAEAPVVLVGGVGTFELISRDARGRELSGAGGYTVLEDALLEATVDTSSLGPDRNWLKLEPFEAGAHTAELAIFGEPVHTVAFDAVATLDGVGILGDETDARRGDALSLWAHGLSSDRLVHGLDPVWVLGPFDGADSGDLLRYEFDPDHEVDVTASFDGLDATRTVHGVGFDVDDSSQVGCSANPRAPLGWLVVALGGLLVRRKSR